jgi:hypothetical protein
LPRRKNYKLDSPNTNTNKTKPKSKSKKPKKEHVYVEKEYKLSPEEREIHIYLDDVDKVWKADVTIPTYINKLIKQGWTIDYIQYYTSTGNNGKKLPKAATFIAPKNAISFRNLTLVKKRTLSDEHKAKLINNNSKFKKIQNSD